MTQAEPLIRNVSDTARWVDLLSRRRKQPSRCNFQAIPSHERWPESVESRLPDPARSQGKTSWPFVARTYLFDRIIQEQIQQGVHMVVNLAAGLDARPYRMALPSTLRWIEVDLPEILAHKEQILAIEKPVCTFRKSSARICRMWQRAAGCFRIWDRRAGV